MDAKEATLELMKNVETICDAHGTSLTVHQCQLANYGMGIFELSIDAYDRRREETFTLDVSAPTLQLLHLAAEKAGLGSFVYDIWQYRNGAYDRDLEMWEANDKFEQQLYNNR